MSHSWESEFRRAVASWLVDHGYGVRSNVYLSDSRRFIDLVVIGDFAVFAVETESNFESALKGVSQAAMYAEGASPDYPERPVYPVVLVPDGHVEEPERSQIEDRTGIPIYEWPNRE